MVLATARLLLPAIAALVIVLVLFVQPKRVEVQHYVPRRRRALRGSLIVVEPEPTRAAPPASASIVRPATKVVEPRVDAVASHAEGTSAGAAQYWPATVSTGRCCALAPATPLNVTLTWPVAMERPIVVLMRAGKVDASFACDVPCQYATRPPPDGHVDVVVGEAARPSVPEQVRASNPHVLSAARSMESNLYYPSLRTLHKVVDVAMLTTRETSLVPVTYLRRSSIAMWGTAPVVWNASALRSLAAASSSSATSSSSSSSSSSGTAAAAGHPRPSAVFVARNCASRNGREQAVLALHARLPGGVARPGSCLNSAPWPSCPKGGVKDVK